MNKVNFVFYGQEGSIFEIHFPLVRDFSSRRYLIKERTCKSRSSQEEAIDEHAQDKASEESVFPVMLHESKVEDRCQNTHKRG